MSVYPPPGMAGPRAIAGWSLRSLASTVQFDGIENVPGCGPVLLAARHYHHLLDGAVLTAHVTRPVHIVVALDWTANALQRGIMERACRWAQYPVILRSGALSERRGYRPAEAQRYLRRGCRDAAALLAAGRLVLVFPEGYPVIDPAAHGSAPVRDADGFAPFASGFRTIVKLARRAGAPPVTIVPVGFSYRRSPGGWDVTARAGCALPGDAAVSVVEAAIRALSSPRGC